MRGKKEHRQSHYYSLQSIWNCACHILKQKYKLSTKNHIRIGTRGSDLALWQAHYLKDALEKVGATAELILIKTQGDRIQHLGFDKMEGKGFFTKEIEERLLGGEIDVAVHSMKDLPTEPTPGLAITAVSYREVPTDTLVKLPEAHDSAQIFGLKQGALVGTSSARRKAQLLHYRPDVAVQDIRGNVPTRLRKLQEGPFDAILLATAGLKRLEIDLSGLEVFEMNPREFIPAPAQGVLAFQTLREDWPTRRLLKHIHQPDVSARTNVERKILKLAGGGCHMPLGAYCEVDAEGNYHVWAAKADTWQSSCVFTRLSSSTHYGLAEQVLSNLESQ